VIATKPDTFDAIVVGSGAGGGFAAMSLAEAGMRVLLLERGRRFDPRRDFPMNHPDWELRPRAFRDTEAPPGDVSLVREEGAPLDPRYAHLHSSSLPGEVLKSGSRRAPFSIRPRSSGSAERRCISGRGPPVSRPRFPPGESLWTRSGLPLSYADLAPYYDRAEHPRGGRRSGQPLQAAAGALPDSCPSAFLRQPAHRDGRGEARPGHCFRTRWRSQPEALMDGHPVSAAGDASTVASSAPSPASI